MATKVAKALPVEPAAEPPAPIELDGRVIRVPKGEQPPHSELDSFQQWAWKTFKQQATSRPPNPTLEENLVRAHMRIRADEYVATVLAMTVIAAGEEELETTAT